jgi:hypothetical protein
MGFIIAHAVQKLLRFALEGLDVCIDILACRVVHVGVNADCLLGQGCEDLELRACERL